MKRTRSDQAPVTGRAKRLNVSEAKAKLSQALRDLEGSPTIIHNRGRDVAVLMSMEEYERLAATTRGPAMRTFLEAVDDLKHKLGGGAALATERISFTPRDPFTGTKRR